MTETLGYEGGHHFTYAERSETHDLMQGDVLTNSGELAEVIRIVHPHYFDNPTYTHFLVLSQSCDLAQHRGAPCSAKYITIAGIRPLHLALMNLLDSKLSAIEKKAQVSGEKSRQQLRQQVETLLNNNSNEYFYLHKDDSFGLNATSCAFLRLSISIRSHEHYERCRGARIFGLKEAFAAKLGWAIGNLYSRVGTVDWAPGIMTRSSFDSLVNRITEESFAWMEEDQLRMAIKAFKAQGDNFELMTSSELRQALKDIPYAPKLERLITQVVQILTAVNALDEEQRSLIERRLRTNKAIKEMLQK